MIFIEGYLLAFLRFLSFSFAFPLFSQRSVPAQLKIGFAALLAIAVAPATTQSMEEFWPWALLALQEIAIGLLLAFFVSLVFGIIYFAGQLIDVPMGFGMVSIFDPQSGMQLPVFSQFYHLLGMLVFLAVDGHLWLFKALGDSYKFLPVNQFVSLDLSLDVILALSQNLFSIGLQIALPIIGSIFLTDIALGIVTKAVPQINVFVIGFPIKIMMGLLVLTLVVPVYVQIAAGLFAYDGLLHQYFYRLLLGE